jgi:hypothetical protein
LNNSGNVIATSSNSKDARTPENGNAYYFIASWNGDSEELTLLDPPSVDDVAIIEFSGIPSDISLASATLVFATEASITDEHSVVTVKSGNKFQAELPEGYPRLKKANFTVEGGESFTYYFPPTQTLALGEQTVSLAPPTLMSYWQGGIVIQINEPEPRTGVNAYNITGTVMAPEIAPSIRWYPNQSKDVTDAMSTTDGAANTAAIIVTLLSPGTSANDMARWAIRVRSGGYSDWYLPVAL